MLHDYRRAWTRVTALESSALHWGQGIVLYMNQSSDVYHHNHAWQRKALDTEREAAPIASPFAFYPAGTILLKENYFLEQALPTAPASVTVMIKGNKDADAAFENWHFVQFDAVGHILVNGNSTNPEVYQACAFCHQGMAERDYVFSTIAPGQKGPL
jgi:hypothetical protein